MRTELENEIRTEIQEDLLHNNVVEMKIRGKLQDEFDKKHA